MKSRDMTAGSPTKNILLFSIPVLLGNLFQQFYNLIDTIIVGRFLGEEALAAVGSTGSIIFLVIGITTGLTQGFGVMISHAFGGKKYEELKHLVALSLLLTVICSLIVSIPAVALSKQFLLLMNTPDDILEYANSYIRVLYTGIIFTMFYNMSASILRAIGDSKTPLYFLILSSVLNIVLDIVLITVIKLETAGAAYATVISQGVAALLCFIYMFRNFDILRTRKTDYFLDWRTILRLLRISIPMALNHSVTALGIMILQSSVNLFGSAVVAAYTAASKVEMLMSQAMMALSASMSTYCGQHLGAHKLDRIYKGIRYAVLMALGIAVFGILFYFTSARFIVSCFITDPSPDIYTYALQYSYTSVWFLFALALIYLFRSSLIGLNNGLTPMLGGAVELISRFVCTRLLAPFGYWCVRLTNPLTWTVTCIILILFYIRWERNSKRKYSST